MRWTNLAYLWYCPLVYGSTSLTFAAILSDPPENTSVSIHLPSQLELPRLVDLASARLAVKVEYDPAVLKGTVALRGLDALSGEQLWDLTNQLLASRGFTTVRPPGAATYSVVRLNDAAALAGLGANCPRSSSKRSRLVTRLQYILKEMLRRSNRTQDSAQMLCDWSISRQKMRPMP